MAMMPPALQRSAGRHKSVKGLFIIISSKQDLFLALMTSWLNEVSESFRASVESSQNIPLAIENIADQSCSLYDALQDGFPLILLELATSE